MTLVALQREKRILEAKRVAIEEYKVMMLGADAIDSPYKKFKKNQLLDTGFKEDYMQVNTK